MKKKIISSLLVVAMLMMVVACGKNDTVASNTNNEIKNNEVVSDTEQVDASVPETDGEAENNTVVSETDGEAIAEAVHEHNYVENVVKEATCTENGTATFTCECGDTYDEEIESTGHDFGDYVADGNASYTADGTKTATCGSCGETDTVADEGSKLNYTYTDLSATKYAASSVNVRDLPSTDGNKLGSLSTNDEVKVTGTCNETGWYRIVYGEGVAYVSNKYLGDAKVEISANSGNSGTGGNAAGGNSLANHFGVTLPFTATTNEYLSGLGFTNLWNSPTSFNAETNLICHLWNGTQVTISDLYGSVNNCMAYLTMPDGTSGWTQFSYKGVTDFTW